VKAKAERRAIWSAPSASRVQSAPGREWEAAVAADLAKRHQFGIGLVPKGVLPNLFIKGLDPARQQTARR